MAQTVLIFIAAGAGFTAGNKEGFSQFGVSVLTVMLETSFVVFLIPGAVIIVLSQVNLIPQLGVFLIQKFVGNTAWIEYLLGAIALLINVIIDPSQVSVRMLLTYVPLVIFSLQQQIVLGVDAIRTLDPSWDDHRGPLYPDLWYIFFNLYNHKKHSTPEDVPAVSSTSLQGSLDH